MSIRVLVCCTSYGYGTVAAAIAVETAILELAPAAHVKRVDLLELPGAQLRRALVAVSRVERDSRYNDASLRRNLPRSLWPLYFLQRVCDLNGFARSRLLPAFNRLVGEGWDAIVSTDSYSAHLLAALELGGGRRLRRLFVCTDFGMHSDQITNPRSDHYFCPNEESAILLRALGIADSDVSVTGIPVRAEFCEPTNGSREAASVSSPPVILQCLGGVSIEPPVDVLSSLLRMERPCSFLVVSGNQALIRDTLARVPVPDRHQVQLIPHTSRMDQLIRSSDIVVTKAGGSTTAELLACGAASVLVSPYLDLELSNSDFLLENGAAVKAAGPSSVAYKVAEVLESPQRLAELRMNSARLARPGARGEVARKIIDLATT